MTKIKFEKIHIYYRQCVSNKPNNTRPAWFNYEKCFKNLLDTINWNICELNVVFDGSLLYYDNHFTKKYQSKYNFRVRQIDTKNWEGKSYEPNCGSSKSGALTSELINEDNLSENNLIYILENDYLHLPHWSEIVLDLFNNLEDQNCYISLYDHLDKYIFNKNNRKDEWSQFVDLKSEIILSSYRHWRTTPLICSSWILPKLLFDRDLENLLIGISDNTHCGIIKEKYKTYFLTPIPSLATHCEKFFMAPFVNWESLVNQTILL